MQFFFRTQEEKDFLKNEQRLNPIYCQENQWKHGLLRKKDEKLCKNMKRKL